MRRFILVVSHLFFASILVPIVSAEEASPDTTAPDTAKVVAKKAAADSSAKKEKEKEEENLRGGHEGLRSGQGSLFRVPKGRRRQSIPGDQTQAVRQALPLRHHPGGGRRVFLRRHGPDPQLYELRLSLYSQTRWQKRAVPAQKRLLQGG